MSEPTASAQQIARTHLQQGQLPNGIPWFLWSDPRDTVVSLDVRVATGSADEVTGQTGLAHMLEHLMFRGTPAVPDGQFDAAMESLGASINAFTWLDYTAYVSTMPPASLAGVLRLEADRFANLQVLPEVFAAERDVVANERRMSVEADPVEALHEQFNARTLDDAPYAHPTIGWADDIAAYTPARVAAFFAQHYNAGTVAVIACGPIDGPTLEAALLPTFGALPAVAPRKRNVVPRSFVEGVTRTRVPIASQRLLLAWPSPGRAALQEWATWALLHELLAGSDGARWTTRLEVEDHLALELDAALDPHRGPGLYRVFVTLRDGVGHKRALAALDEELGRLAADGPTRDEVQSARMRMRTRDASSLAATASRADWMADSWVTFGDPLRGFAMLEAVDRVRRPQLQALAHALRYDLPRSVTWAQRS